MLLYSQKPRAWAKFYQANGFSHDAAQLSLAVACLIWLFCDNERVEAIHSLS